MLTNKIEVTIPVLSNEYHWLRSKQQRGEELTGLEERVIEACEKLRSSGFTSVNKALNNLNKRGEHGKKL